MVKEELIPDQEDLHGIFDIDGSLVKYVYGDQELLKDQARLNSVLSLLQPFPWVSKSKLITKTTRISLISGRKTPQRILTELWLKKSLGIYKPDLVLVGYESREQYSKDKKRLIEEKANQFRKRKRVPIVFLDDDPEILDWLSKTFRGKDDFVIAVDKVGNARRL